MYKRQLFSSATISSFKCSSVSGVLILSLIHILTSYAAKHEARFMKLLIEQNEDGGKRRLSLIHISLSVTVPGLFASLVTVGESGKTLFELVIF